MQNLKRTLTILLAVVTLLSVTACGKKKTPAPETEDRTVSYTQDHEHDWLAATCTEPETCRSCGLEQGVSLGHDWLDATCTEPETCERCGEMRGEPLGHVWLAATCAAPETCETCGETQGDALAHVLTEATYYAPAACEVCGETVGEPLPAAMAGYELVAEGELREYITTGYGDYADQILTHHVRFTNYHITDTYNGEAAREGYEWRVIDVDFIADDPNVSVCGFNYGWCFFDYHTGVAPYEGDTIWYNGTEHEIFNEISTIKAEWIEGDVITAELVVEVAFEVPVGYDGIVMSAQNAQYVNDGVTRTHISELTGYAGEGVYFRLA